MSVTSFGTPNSAPPPGLPGNPAPALQETPASNPNPAQTGAHLFAIARIGQARQALADMLVCYSRLLQSNEDASSRVQLRSELANLLIDKDPELLDCVLEIAGKRRKASGPRLLQLIDEIVAISKRYESAGIPETDPAWADLRAMIERLISTYHQRVEEILPKLDLNGPPGKLVPQWLLDADKALKSVAAVDKLPGLLAQSPSSMLDGAGFSQAVDALDELVVAHMDSESERLAAHLATALKSYSKEDRIKAVAGLSLVIENSMDQSARTVVQLEDALMEGCARETSETVLKPYLTYLLGRTVALFNHGYYERSMKHAETVGFLERSFRKAMGEDAINPAREAVGELSKTAWAQNLAEQLLAGGERELAAETILSVIDRNLSTTLIACITREDSRARAQQFAIHLNHLCPGSAKSFVAMMNAQNDRNTLIRMLAVAPYAGADDEVLEIIYPLLTHTNFELRAAALQFVLERDNERTAAFVSARLRDPHGAPQREMWMGILTKLQHPAAATVILGELQLEIDSPMQDDRRMMILIDACNVHEDARIGSVLARLLRPTANSSDTRRMNPKQRENAKAIKLAAMKALIRYTKDPRVSETFERLRRDPDLDLARMAAYCVNPGADPGRRATVQSVLVSGANPLPAPNASEMTQTGGIDPFQKPRRGFEELEQRADIDAIFQPGAAIGGKPGRMPTQMNSPIPGMPLVPVTPMPGPTPGGVQFSGKQSTLDPSQLPDDLFAGMKPLLEGELQDLGLGMTARITGAKNGVMMIKSSLGNGAIYIQNKVVVAAFFSGMTDIQALAAIGKLKQAKFAYFAKAFQYAATMSVEVSNIETAVREYLDMR